MCRRWDAPKREDASLDREFPACGLYGRTSSLEEELQKLQEFGSCRIGLGSRSRALLGQGPDSPSYWIPRFLRSVRTLLSQFVCTFRLCFLSPEF